MDPPLPPLLNTEILLRKSLFILTEFTVNYKSLKKMKINILTCTLHCCLFWQANSASDLCSIHVLLRLHKYDGCDIDMNIRQNSKNLFTKKF